MFAVERRKKILEMLNLNGSVLVNDLSRDLEVTVETIRRDLERLEQLEQLTRTHGGAVLYEENVVDLSLEKRSELNIDGKIAISKKAITLIKPGDVIFLDGSTTSYYLSKLVKELRDVTVVTNNLQILNELSKCDKIKVVSIGGFLDASNLSFVGEVAVSNINSTFCANKVFFSSKGILKDKGILESNDVEYQVKKAMIKNSEKKYFIADSSKFNRVGFIKLANFSEIDGFITDIELDNEWKNILKKNKVGVVL
jgi:DeoR/GlpR family transcriptional regulator of sugar metabolism